MSKKTSKLSSGGRLSIAVCGALYQATQRLTELVLMEYIDGYQFDHVHLNGKDSWIRFRLSRRWNEKWFHSELLWACLDHDIPQLIDTLSRMAKEHLSDDSCRVMLAKGGNCASHEEEAKGQKGEA